MVLFFSMVYFVMIMNYSECCEKYGGRYRTEHLIRNGELHKVALGLYSDKPSWSDVEVVLARYPNAVLTLQSAYYYYDLSDSIPEAFHLATDRDATKIYDGQKRGTENGTETNLAKNVLPFLSFA